jgi:hypothetical protein
MDLTDVIADDKAAAESLEIDAIAKKMHDAAAGHNTKTEDALEQVCGMIAALTNMPRKERFIQSVSVIFNLKKKTVADQVKAIEKKRSSEEKQIPDDRRGWTFPKGVDEWEAYQKGFYVIENGPDAGYWFAESANNWVKSTNFIIKPLYHIYSLKAEFNRKMIHVISQYEDRVVEMPGKQLLSVEAFCGELFNQGHFLPEGNFGKPKLLKLLNSFAHSDFPKTYELTMLGMQSEGFFAFNNKIYRPKTKKDVGLLVEYNEYGIAEIDGTCYLSPSVSRLNEQGRQGSDDIYENDKYLSFVKSKHSFETWAKQMCLVFDKTGWTAIAFCVATIHRDVIFKRTRIPHYYLYGQTGSGKSELGESISNFFFSGKDANGLLYKPMNLNQGTDFAFWNRYERFANVPNVLNELDENVELSWKRGLKSSFDGEGRSVGMKDKGGTKSRVMKVSCSTVLMGQFLLTEDDNSLVNRSVVHGLIPVQNRTDESTANIKLLKQMEQDGLSSILCELLDQRMDFVDSFPEKYTANQKKLLERAKANGLRIESRVNNNFAALCACIELVAEQFKLPFTYNEFVDEAYSHLRRMSTLLASSSGMSQFWKMMEFMLDRGLLTYGIEFKVKTVDEEVLQKYEADAEPKKYEWKEFPQKVLYVRFNVVHKLYMEQTKRINGHNGINEDTLLLYLMNQPYYLGKKKSMEFDKPGAKGRFVTTCLCFKYDELKIDIDRSDIEEEPTRLKRIMGKCVGKAEEVSIDGIYKFKVIEVVQKESNNATETYSHTYTCFTKLPQIMIEAEQGINITLLGSYTEKEFNNGHTDRKLDVINYCLQWDKDFKIIPSADKATPMGEISVDLENPPW